MQDVDLIILGIIAEAPRYAQDVDGVLDRRRLRHWVSVGEVSVYYLLDRLEARRLIVAEMPYDQLRSARKVYTITAAGRALLNTALVDRLSASRGGLGTFEIGLLLAHLLPAAQVRDALNGRRMDLASRLEAAQTALAAHTDADHQHHMDVRRALYTRLIALLEADLDWLTAFEVAWEDHQAGE